MKTVLLFSGGIDSLASYCILKNQGKSVDKFLYLHFGVRYNREEVKAVYKLLQFLGEDEKYGWVDLDFVQGFEDAGTAEIPYRNLLAVVVAKYFGDKVVLSIEEGTQRNISRDRSDAFMRLLNRLYKYLDNKQRLSVVNPVRNLTKQDEVKVIKDYFGDKAQEVIDMTFSCYFPVDGKHCGNCPACIRKFFALYYNGLEFNNIARNPIESDVFKVYVGRIERGVYKGRRGRQYREVLENLRREGWKI